jgi:hypothetical protein
LRTPQAAPTEPSANGRLLGIVACTSERPSEFAKVISEARSFINKLTLSPHSDQCDSSCFDCLRDYHNMAFHLFLAWRLGRDMLDLLEGSSFDVTACSAIESELSESFCHDFGANHLDLDGSVHGVDAEAPWSPCPAAL